MWTRSPPFVNDLAAPTFVEQQIDVGVPVLQQGINCGEKIAHGGGALYVYLPGDLLQRVDSCQPFTI